LKAVVREKNELRVAIVGCGKIADAHLAQLHRVSGCRVVGACDREPLMARQLCDRFQIERPFSDIGELLAGCQPDVVHITTPPQSHLELGKRCLQAGCHVYIEKPFTLCTKDAEELIRLAAEKGLKVTVGHDLQFSHVARRMRKLVQEGYLGGPPVHMESYYCYDLSDPGYAKAFLADKEHWVRRLPGKLLHNIISHGIARIAEFLTSDSPQVVAQGFVSPQLKALGEHELVDELRVLIRDDGGRTAYFTFSSQMRPSLNQFRLYGPRNGLLLDEDEQSLLKLRGARFKSYAEKFIPPMLLAGQHLANASRNVRKFLAADFHMKSGMKCLIESFYGSIAGNAPPPISHREILLTSQIMDEIFKQIYGWTDDHLTSEARQKISGCVLT
jgi:predicted dehydrogenase